MFNIALTGGIASGKSTIAKLFRAKNIFVIDTDDIAKDLVLPNSFGLKKITEHFGIKVLHSDQSLNREALGEIIFNSKQEKQWLEDLLHPLIFKELFKTLHNSTSPYTLSIIPLLYETNSKDQFDRIITIETNTETQILRLQKRNNLSEDDTLLRLSAQTNEASRLSIANDVIQNFSDTSLSQLEQSIKNLHKKFLRLSLAN